MWGSPYSWANDEVVSAEQLNNALRDDMNLLRWTAPYKSADESVTNNASPQNDDALFFAVAIGETWVFHARIVWQQGAGGIRWLWTGPTNGVGSYASAGEDGAAASFGRSALSLGVEAATITGDHFGVASYQEVMG